jgi:hypothetical protein
MKKARRLRALNNQMRADLVQKTIDALIICISPTQPHTLISESPSAKSCIWSGQRIFVVFAGRGAPFVLRFFFLPLPARPCTIRGAEVREKQRSGRTGFVACGDDFEGWGLPHPFFVRE